MSDVYSDEYRSAPADAPPATRPRLKRAAGALLFLLLVVGMSIWAYRLGTRDAAEIPIIRAMDTPARVQPENPGGSQAAHQGLELNSVLGAEPEPVPAPEAASVAALPPPALQDEDGPQGELILGLPTLPTITLPQDGETPRMPPAEDAPDPAAPQELDVAALIQSLTAEAGEPDPHAEATAPGPRPLTRPAGHTARAALQEAAPPPAAAPAPSATVPATAPPAAPRELASVAPGARLVQLGAFDSEALARQTWAQLSGRHDDLLGAKSLFLERATNNARVFYRLRVANFGSADETRILCEQLRARGVDCIPVTLN